MKRKPVSAPENTLPNAREKFSLASFDRDAQLSQLEKDTVTLWTDKSNKRTCPKKSHPGLKRLVGPLQAALDYFGAAPPLQSTVCNVIIREMHSRQTAYWAWGENEWLEILGDGQPGLKRNDRSEVQGRFGLLACAYLLHGSPIIKHVTHFQQISFAYCIFGMDAVKAAINIVAAELTRLGIRPTLIKNSMPGLLSEAMLLSDSPKLADISLDTLTFLSQKPKSVTNIKRACLPVARALHNLGIIHQPLKQVSVESRIRVGVNDTVADEWYAWVLRWYNTSTAIPSTRKGLRGKLCKVGRWLAENYPEIKSPAQWTREVCLAYVAAINKAVLGQWMHPDYRLPKDKVGKPMEAHSKAGLFAAARTFFLDCQEWEWIPMTFDPRRYLGCPASVKRLRGPKPRVIADDVWAKLLYAGMSLTREDLPGTGLYEFNGTTITKEAFYPLEMIKTVVLVWLFTGMRQNEIQRLRVGCVKWIEDADSSAPDSVPQRSVCMLTVPISKTANEFNKPVDYIVGEAIQAWESMRPDTVSQIDHKTGEKVDFLFEWRGKRMSQNYINNTVIPMLCKKAGMPERDAKGNITSHRARSTIATQLFNSREPMSLFELQEWLGHSSPLSTQYYAQINPTKLTKAYRDAGYFSRNVRLIDIVLDQDAIRSGAAASGVPHLYYDLSHGYCTYDFFDKCLHRMACAKCAFYQPKESSYTQILEAKENLLRLQQSIPLTEMEQSAVDEGIETYDELTAHLSQRLKDTPTPQGPTPRELHG